MMNAETHAALALVAAGLPVAQVERVMPMVEAIDSDSAESIAEKVSALVADVPGLFTEGRTAKRPGAEPTQQRPNGKVTGIEAGRELARSRASQERTHAPFQNFRPAGAPDPAA